MKRITYMSGLVTVALLFFAMATTVDAARVPLQTGMEVSINFPGGAVTSNQHQVGDTLEIELAEPVVVGTQIIVEKGAPGKAVVTDVKNNGAGGKPGFIKVEFLHFEPTGVFRTLDGSPVLLNGTAEDEGNGKKLLSYLLLYFFVKGGSGELAADGAYPATIERTVVLTDEQ